MDLNTAANLLDIILGVLGLLASDWVRQIAKRHFGHARHMISWLRRRVAGPQALPPRADQKSDV
jgi:hypothetical protein